MASPDVLYYAAEDPATDALISEILYDEIQEFAFANEAEKLQLAELAVVFDIPEEKQSKLPLAGAYDDIQLVLRLVAEDLRAATDFAYAEALQKASEVQVTETVTSMQFAQKLAAAEKKNLIDSEFAKKLQDLIDSGQAVDTVDDAEGTLGKEVIDNLLAGDRNDKGKGKDCSEFQPEMLDCVDQAEPLVSGKGKGRANVLDIPESTEKTVVPISDPYPICKLCWDPFQLTASPLAATLSANTSNRIPFGLRLPCPDGHAYCIGCLSSYIQSKLDPEGDGTVSHSAVVFPIPCPECSSHDWYQGLNDDIAERVLDKNALDQWYYRRVLDSLPKYYCPNQRCSALVVIPEDPTETQAICPSCQCLICVPCRSIWHSDISCLEYQSLPLDERLPEDRQAIQLARKLKWRRCPTCSMMVELSDGCNHITCRCRTQFCFKCGSVWDIARGGCPSDPPCLMWDDEMMLLNENDREQERIRQRIENEAPIEVENPPALLDTPIRADLAWMNEQGLMCDKHWFTKGMAQNLACGYCHATFISLDELQHHLANAGHSAFCCCGRFFKRNVDLEKHQSFAGRFGGAHLHEFRRDLGIN